VARSKLSSLVGAFAVDSDSTSVLGVLLEEAEEPADESLVNPLVAVAKLIAPLYRKLPIAKEFFCLYCTAC